MTFTDFLTWGATSAGVNAIVGFFESFAIEWIPGFDACSPRQKRAVAMATSFIVPLACTLALWPTTGAIPNTESLWQATLAGFASYFTGQTAHMRQLPN